MAKHSRGMYVKLDVRNQYWRTGVRMCYRQWWGNKRRDPMFSPAQVNITQRL